MKTLLSLAVLVALFSSILTGPIPEQSKGFFVTTVNKTAVCVVKRSVYQDGERLPMDDPCEICRCRPPGFACAYVRCAKKDPKPGCNIVDLVGQCCPQYRCAEKEVLPAVPLVPEVTIKPLNDDDLEAATKIATIDNEIVAKNDLISTSGPLDTSNDEKVEAKGEDQPIKPETPIADVLKPEDLKSEIPKADGLKPEELKPETSIATESPLLEQRNDDLLPEASTERPLVGDLAKSLDEAEKDVTTLTPELPREERVETNDLPATDTAKIPEDNEAGRSELLITTSVPLPVQNDKEAVEEKAEERADDASLPETVQPLIAEVATALPELRIADAILSTLPPEKFERKEDDSLLVEITSLAPVKEQEAVVQEHHGIVAEPAKGESLTIELITEQPILNETLTKDRRKRETVEILEKGIIPVTTSVPLPNDSIEIKEKADESVPEEKEFNTKAEADKDVKELTKAEVDKEVNLALDQPAITENSLEKAAEPLFKEQVEDKKIVLSDAVQPLPESDATTIRILD